MPRVANMHVLVDHAHRVVQSNMIDRYLLRSSTSTYLASQAMSAQVVQVLNTQQQGHDDMAMVYSRVAGGCVSASAPATGYHSAHNDQSHTDAISASNAPAVCRRGIK